MVSIRRLEAAIGIEPNKGFAVSVRLVTGSGSDWILSHRQTCI